MPDTLKMFKEWSLKYAKTQCAECNDLYYAYVGAYRSFREKHNHEVIKLREENEALHKIILRLTSEEKLSDL